MDGLVLALIAVVAIVLLVAKLYTSRAWQSFEVDEATLGIGDQKLTLKPNSTDRQIAYQIWVELSTRKIGLPIDLEHDVIEEIYNSWYEFFGVTRDLIKDIPVSKFRRRDTEKIIRMSIDLLNEGLRPHLTKWQARYRRWYERAAVDPKNADLAPQEIQQAYTKFDELSADLLEVNERLMLYRQKMHELVTGLPAPKAKTS